MRAYLELITLDVHTVEDPNTILNFVDEALKELLADTDRTAESELRVIIKCREVIQVIHERFTPVEYRLQLE